VNSEVQYEREESRIFSKNVLKELHVFIILYRFAYRALWLRIVRHLFLSRCSDERCFIICRAAASSSELHETTNRWQILPVPPLTLRPPTSSHPIILPPEILSVQLQVRLPRVVRLHACCVGCTE
jgi:hypothetical protein